MPSVNSRLLLVKFRGSQKLYADSWLRGGQRSKSPCCSRSTIDIHVSFKEVIQFRRADLLLTASQEPKFLQVMSPSLPRALYHRGGRSWVTVALGFSRRRAEDSAEELPPLSSIPATEWHTLFCSCSVSKNLDIWSHLTSRHAWIGSLAGKSFIWLYSQF